MIPTAIVLIAGGFAWSDVASYSSSSSFEMGSKLPTWQAVIILVILAYILYGTITGELEKEH